MNYLERWYFIIGKSMHMEYRKIPLYKINLLPQSPVYRKEKEPLYEPVNYHLHLFFHRRLSQRQHTLCLLDSEDIIPERYLCIKLYSPYGHWILTLHT